MTPEVRIACFGLPLAACLLSRDGHDVVLAVLSPVEAPGRRRLRRQIGAERVLDAAKLGSTLEPRAEAALRSLGPDLVVSWYWTRRLPVEWLGMARLGAIGAHPSLLPRHRGPNPFFWAIDSGDPVTGVSVHRLTGEYDDGAVLAALEVPTGERNGWQLARALDRPSLVLIRQTVRALADGRRLEERAQDPAAATWAPEPEGDALRVDWSWPTERVLRRIRALSPVPGLAIELCDRHLFVTRAEPAAATPPELLPGEAKAVGEPPSEVVIRTGDGAIAILAAVHGSAEGDEEAENFPIPELAQLVASRTRAV